MTRLKHELAQPVVRLLSVFLGLVVANRTRCAASLGGVRRGFAIETTTCNTGVEHVAMGRHLWLHMK